MTDVDDRGYAMAGVRRIRLHDIRHTYATLSLDSGITPKILSDRIGHLDRRVTFQVYGHRSAGQDREAAELVAAPSHRASDGTRQRGRSSKIPEAADRYRAVSLARACIGS